MQRLIAPRLAASPRARALVSTLALVPAFVAGCGIREVAPPETPAKVVPQAALAAPPLKEGEGQVLVDATNGPAAVSISLQQHMQLAAGDYVGSAAMSLVTPICATTPCIANLPYGTYNVVFEGKNDPTYRSSDLLTIGPEPTVFRHTMGVTKDSGAVGTLGGTSFTLGLIGSLVGGLMYAIASASGESDVKTAGGVTLAVGGGMMVLGIPLMILDRPTLQRGSSSQWPLNDSPSKSPVVAPAHSF